MYFNLEWLSEHLGQEIDAERLAERLTMAGLEVDSMAAHINPLDHVVTAQIQKITPHPQADRLNLCEIEVGAGETYQIVCGAANIYEGMHVAFAKVGAQLGDVKIKAAKIRGVESKGMLCSATELDLGQDSQGLLDLGDVELGKSITDYIPSSDVIYKLDLTPNRGDCLSLSGIAREVAALYDYALTTQATETLVEQHQQLQEVEVKEQSACPLYIARIITGLNRHSLAPLSVRERLRRCGIRSVHPVVDILNYVMLERGQPMHAFDKSKIAGALVVRYAKPGETMLAIGGEELRLKETHLVISDCERVHAIAGVIGAEYSAVTEQTEAVVLECAFFSPKTISGCARAYGLQTDASHRFERGVDFGIQQDAIDYASVCIAKWLGGAVGPATLLKDSALLPQRNLIPLSLKRLNRRLGISVDHSFVETSLSSLGCQLQKRDQDADMQGYIPPSWRFDLEIEDDLIEEIARIYGYDNIPDVFYMGVGSFPTHEHRSASHSQMRQCLVQSGYHEAVTYSFNDPTSHAMFCDTPAVRVQNPISEEMSVLSATLWPNLLQTASRNLARQIDQVKLFQVGRVFNPQNDGTVSETLSLAGVACGAVMPEQWGSGEGDYDFYQIKGDVERLLYAVEDLRFVKGSHKALHPWQCADIFSGSTKIGCLGQLSPQVLKPYKISMPVMLFEIYLPALAALPMPQYSAVSPYPSIRRDLAITLPEDKEVADLIDSIRAAAPSRLCDIVIFDIFMGGSIKAGYKSIGVGLVFQDLDKTLKKEDSDTLIDVIIKAIESFGGLLREST